MKLTIAEAADFFSAHHKIARPLNLMADARVLPRETGLTKLTKLTKLLFHPIQAMTIVSTHEAKTHLSRYLAEVELGAEIVIMRGQKPVARLIPYVPSVPQNRPKVGATIGSRLKVPDEAVRALSTQELREWGL